MPQRVPVIRCWQRDPYAPEPLRPLNALERALLLKLENMRRAARDRAKAVRT